MRKAEFFKLSDYTVSPCNGCLGCIKSNRCIIEDDGVMLTEKALLHGPEATPASVGIRSLEEDSETVAALKKLGEDIATTYFNGG